MDNVAEVMEILLRMKEEKRRGWELLEIPGSESVADHSFSLAALAFLVAPHFGIQDRSKCAVLALFHDIAEVVTGDITPHDAVPKEKKRLLESQAVESISMAVNDPSIQALWEEFEDAKSPESRLVHDLDVIEALFQALEYESRFPEKAKGFDQFWESGRDRLSLPLSRRLFDQLRVTRRTRE